MQELKKIIFLIIILIIIFIFSIVIIIKKQIIKNVGDILKQEENIIYIKEYETYIPYIVLENNYNGNNSLLLRLNTIGNDEEYIIDYNGSIVKEKIYNCQLEMQQFAKYEETDVDKFLNEDFKRRFNSIVLKNIQDVELNFYRNVNGVEENYSIKRKFFILSESELGFDSAYEKENNNIKYFDNSEKRISYNDVGRLTVYWTRTYGWNSYTAIGGNGNLLSQVGTGAKYSIRPAFTIPSNTKIKKLMMKININIH